MVYLERAKHERITQVLPKVAQAPKINSNVSKITGVICGYRLEEIEDKLMQ